VRLLDYIAVHRPRATSEQIEDKGFKRPISNSRHPVYPVACLLVKRYGNNLCEVRQHRVKFSDSACYAGAIVARIPTSCVTITITEEFRSTAEAAESDAVAASGEAWRYSGGSRWSHIGEGLVVGVGVGGRWRGRSNWRRSRWSAVAVAVGVGVGVTGGVAVRGSAM